jgi:DNA-binding MarR family transcriptional regulator
MEEMRLISRVRDRGDRRHVTARITPHGEKVLEKATPALEEVERVRFGQLDSARLGSLIEALADVRGNP